MTNTTITSDPDICEKGGSGLLLPAFGDDEQAWDSRARAVIYAVGLCWCFLGVSIIADVFMAGIEAVTSKRKTATLANGQTVTLKVWNATVANLTLMALGSSAPEILLNVIEILSNEFYAGPLGPSTIVGSAAFNLLMIMAICIIAIPSGESRTIGQVEPFLVTAFFSVFAYLWLIFVLGINTPDLVELWEGMLTFIFFPVLVVLAFMADKGFFSSKHLNRKKKEEDIKASLMEAGMEVTDADVHLLHQADVQQTLDKTKTRAARRAEQVCAKAISPKDVSVGFLSQRYCFHEDSSQLLLEVEKVGEVALEMRVGIEYQTSDGNMLASEGHYSHSKSLFLEIPQGSKYAKAILPRPPESHKVSRMQDNLATHVSGGRDSVHPHGGELTPVAYYYLDIVQAVKLPCVSTTGSVLMDLAEEILEASNLKINILPDFRRARIAISEEKGTGQIKFMAPQVTVHGGHEPREELFCVKRFNGFEGELRCHYRLEPDSAKPGFDYEHKEGVLIFSAGEASKDIRVTILEKKSFETSDKFYILLSNVAGFPPALEKEEAIMSVQVSADKALGIKNKMLRVMDEQINFDAFNEGNMEWKAQIKAALRPNAGGDDDDLHQASAADWTIHVVALPWKMLFSLVPPPTYCDGWLCFGIALAMIGGVTAIIGDLASLLGCVIGFDPGITAITIVAVGTSLPDAFASKTAATEDETADNAIGNVTGSNSVNVFLGIGLPWVAATIFWNGEGTPTEWKTRYPEQALLYPGGGFVVIAGDLVFSVICFSIAAVMCLTLIWYRRKAFKAELGGPDGAKINSCIFLVCLWFFYVALAIWKIMAGQQTLGAQVVAIVVGCIGVAVGMVLLSAMVSLYNCCKPARDKDTDLKAILNIVTGNGGASRAFGIPDSLNLNSMDGPELLSRLKEQVAGMNALTQALETKLSLTGILRAGANPKEKIDKVSDSMPRTGPEEKKDIMNSTTFESEEPLSSVSSVRTRKLAAASSKSDAAESEAAASTSPGQPKKKPIKKKQVDRGATKSIAPDSAASV